MEDHEKLKEKYKQEYIKYKNKHGVEHIREINAKAREKYRSTEKGKKMRKKWKHSETSKNYDRAYRKKYMQDPLNREKQNKWSRAWSKTKYKTDLKFRIRLLTTGRIRRAVKMQRTGKSKSTEKLVGCEFRYLIKYLESKFKTGMSWENIGEWHIDHIKPCVSFDLMKEKEQKRCFHYTNLQPLWAKENIIKGSKINYELIRRSREDFAKSQFIYQGL